MMRKEVMTGIIVIVILILTIMIFKTKERKEEKIVPEIIPTAVPKEEKKETVELGEEILKDLNKAYVALGNIRKIKKIDKTLSECNKESSGELTICRKGTALIILKKDEVVEYRDKDLTVVKKSTPKIEKRQIPKEECQLIVEKTTWKKGELMSINTDCREINVYLLKGNEKIKVIPSFEDCNGTIESNKWDLTLKDCHSGKTFFLEGSYLLEFGNQELRIEIKDEKIKMTDLRKCMKNSECIIVPTEENSCLDKDGISLAINKKYFERYMKEKGFTKVEGKGCNVRSICYAGICYGEQILSR